MYVHVSKMYVAFLHFSVGCVAMSLLSPNPVLTCGAVGPPPVFDCSGNNPASSIRCQYDRGPFFDCKFEGHCVCKHELVCANGYTCR